MAVITLETLQAQLTDAANAPGETFNAPESVLEIEGFEPNEGQETVMKSRVFSSGNPGWRMDCSGKLHGIKVRLQLNATVAGLKRKK